MTCNQSCRGHGVGVNVSMKQALATEENVLRREDSMTLIAGVSCVCTSSPCMRQLLSQFWPVCYLKCLACLQLEQPSYPAHCRYSHICLVHISHRDRGNRPPPPAWCQAFSHCCCHWAVHVCLIDSQKPRISEVTIPDSSQHPKQTRSVNVDKLRFPKLHHCLDGTRTERRWAGIGIDICGLGASGSMAPWTVKPTGSSARKGSET